MQILTAAVRRRKAVSSILATVILFCMLATAGSVYVLSMTNINLAYTQSLFSRGAAMQGASSESLAVYPSLLSGHIVFYVNNTGSVGSNITSVLVLDSAGNILKCDGVGFPTTTTTTSTTTTTTSMCGNTSPALPMGIVPSKKSSTFDTGYTYVSGVDSVQVLTQRGNTFSATYPSLLPTGALQAQSIGPLTANLQSMKWMQPTGNQQTGGLVAGYPTISVAPAPQSLKLLNVNNTGINACGSSTCTVTITTKASGCLIYAIIWGDEGSGTISSTPSDGSHLTWTQRQYTTLTSGGSTFTLYTYYAIASGKLTNDVLTVQFSGSDEIWIAYLAIANFNTASPFDPNLSVAPVNTNAGSSTASVSVTTTNPNDIIIGAVKWDETVMTPTGATGYTVVGFSSVTSDNDAAFEYESVGSTGQYVPSMSLGSSLPWVEIGDAIQGYPNYLNSELPITLTNGQSTQTPNSFQQEIVWNPSLWSSFEAADLGNIRFCSDATCNTLLYSWLESCTSSCTPTANSAIAWVLLPSNIAANGGTLTIYMSFLSTSTEFDGNYWGEAPQLSPGWAQYDNGAKVFTTFYDNFAGYSLNANNWQTVIYGGGSITVNNGLSISATSSSYNPMLLSKNTYSPAIEDASLALASGQTSSSTPTLFYATNLPGTSGGDYGFKTAYRYDWYSYSSLFRMTRDLSGSATGGPTTSYTLPSTFNVWSATWSATGKEYFAFNYATQLTWTDSGITYGSAYVGASGVQGGLVNLNWFRLRAVPPNNVMPTVTFNGPGYVMFSALLTDEDPMGRGITLWPDSSIAVMTTTRAGQQPTTTVVNFFIVNGLTGGTSPTGIVAYNSTSTMPFTHLAFNTPTTVYFGASAARGSTMVVLGNPSNPFQAMFTLTGQYDDNSLYGQTIPFPSGISTKSVATLSRVSGPVSTTTVTVTGNGFMTGSVGIVGMIDPAGKLHVLTLTGGLTKFTTSSSGIISGVSFVVPSSLPGYGTVTPGYYTIIVTDFINSDFFTFQVTSS